MPQTKHRARQPRQYQVPVASSLYRGRGTCMQSTPPRLRVPCGSLPQQPDLTQAGRHWASGLSGKERRAATQPSIFAKGSTWVLKEFVSLGEPEVKDKQGPLHIASFSASDCSSVELQTPNRSWGLPSSGATKTVPGARRAVQCAAHTADVHENKNPWFSTN
jgi:hypothetical protein